LDAERFAFIAEFFLRGVVASHVLYALLCANNGNLDVTLRLRGWRVQDWFSANPVGKLSQAATDPPEELQKVE
jgi:hypothetical protein